MSWVEYFVMAAALAAVVWTMKRNFFKNVISEHRSSKETLNHTSSSLQSITTNDCSENSTSIDTDYYTDNECDEISIDMSIEIKYKQTVNEKNATICSGYGSTGDNTQESIQNTSNESNNIQDTSNSDLINSDSFGTNSYGNGQYSQIGEFTKDDEGNENQIITNTKTFFTNRKYKNIKCVNEGDSTTNEQLFTKINVVKDYDRMSKLNDIVKSELKKSEQIRKDSEESFDINFSIIGSELDSILNITNIDNHIVSTDFSENNTSTHCKSQNTEQFYDSNSYTSSDSFEETLPSTIYSDDSNSANDIWCVEDYSDVSFINSTTSDNLNKAFIEE